MRRMVAVLAAVLLTISAAACGASSPGAKEPDSSPTVPGFSSSKATDIVKSAATAMRSLRSFRMQLSDAESGLAADMHVAEDGSCQGLVQIGDDVRVRIISTADATYQLGDKTYWSQDADTTKVADRKLVAAASDHWVKSPRMTQYANVCDLHRALDRADLETMDERDLMVGPARSGDYSVVAVTARSDEGLEKLLISTEEPHYILSLSGEGGGLALTFSEFNEPVAIALPADPVDLVQLLAP